MLLYYSTVLCYALFLYMHICMYLWLYHSIYLSILGLVISANKSPKSPPHVLPTGIGDRKCTDDGFGLGAWNRKGSYEPSTSWLIVSPSVPRCVKWTHTCFFKDSYFLFGAWTCRVITYCHQPASSAPASTFSFFMSGDRLGVKAVGGSSLLSGFGARTGVATGFTP